MLPLRCAIQDYAWGVPATTSSKVLSLARWNGVKVALDPDAKQRFAELCNGCKPGAMGTDAPAEAPTTAADDTDGGTLEDWLSGPLRAAVLSIDKALPLQAHPPSVPAKLMHANNPKMYPDSAPKPEMVVALTGFCGFAGFLTFDKLSQLLGRVPDLSAVLGDANVQSYLAAGPDNDGDRQQALAAMVQQLLLHTSREACAHVAGLMLQRLQGQAAGSEGGGASSSSTGARFPKLHTQDYAQHAAGARLAADEAKLEGPPSGVVTSCDLALALGVVGQPGGCSQRDVMLSAAARAWPDDPAGEALEVQAASNNTIKGGLTAHGEPTDKATLVDIITAGLGLDDPALPLNISNLLISAGLAPGPGSAVTESRSATAGMAPPSNMPEEPEAAASGLFEGPPETISPVMPMPDGHAAEALHMYQPAVEEFQLWHVAAKQGGSGHGVVKAGVVTDDLLVDEVELQPGAAFFIPAGSSVSFSSSNAAEALDMWITTANSRLFTAAPPAAAGNDAAAAHAAGGASLRQFSGDVEPDATFTAAEQAAAAIMQGAAHSSTPANIADATAAKMAGVGLNGGVERQWLSSFGLIKVERDSGASFHNEAEAGSQQSQAGGAVCFRYRRRLHSSSEAVELLKQRILDAVAADNLDKAQALRTLQQKHVDENAAFGGRSLLQIPVDCRALAAINPIIPCADPGCLTFRLARNATTGAITCRAPAPPPPGRVAPVPVNEFSYFLVYDYDQFFNTDGDHVVVGGSAKVDTIITNQATSSNGKWGLASTREDSFENRAIPNPLLGYKADTKSTIVPLNTESSVQQDKKAPVSFNTLANAGGKFNSQYGAYLPGTKAAFKEVKDGGKDDQVVFLGNKPALYGYFFGRKRRS
eukprot:gene1208-1545_t